MNLFGHWVPSLLHFKAGRQAAFLLSRKILKSNASAISHHRNVCVSACGRICSQHKAASPSCTNHWETEEKYPYRFSHVTSSVISSNFFFFIPPSAGENEAVLKGLFPHMSMWVTVLLCSIDLGFGIIWKKKIPWLHTCFLDQSGMYVSSSKTLSSLYYAKKYL